MTLGGDTFTPISLRRKLPGQRGTSGNGLSEGWEVVSQHVLGPPGVVLSICMNECMTNSAAAPLSCGHQTPDGRGRVLVAAPKGAKKKLK